MPKVMDNKDLNNMIGDDMAELLCVKSSRINELTIEESGVLLSSQILCLRRITTI